MKVEFVDILMFIMFSQVFILALFLFFINFKNNKLPNKIFAFFLIAKALCISNFLSMRLKGFFFENFPHIFYFGSSFTILFGPLLYLYIRSLLFKNFKLGKKDIIHFVPFCLHFLYITFNYHIYSADTKREILSSQPLFTPSLSLFIIIIIYVYTLVYTLLTIQELYVYRTKLKELYSSFESIYFSWMNIVLFGFLAKWLADVWYLYDVHSKGVFNGPGLIVSRLILFVLVNIMIFKGMKQTEIFSGIEKNEVNNKHSLSEIVYEHYLEKLLSILNKKKSYLVPSITLEKLAREVDIPPRSLSEVIQRAFNKNFYDLINSYRIKESEKLLTDRSNKLNSILDVMYEVGFNSKSSFYTAFKNMQV